jgi:hypothetical protein
VSTTDDFDWDSFLNHTTTASFPYQTEANVFGDESMPLASEADTMLWTDMFLGDTNIDWIGLGDSLSI